MKRWKLSPLPVSRQTALAFKIASSSLLLAATLGLLWHQPIETGYANPRVLLASKAHQLLVSAFHGWLPAVVEMATAIPSTLSAIGYVLTCTLIIASYFAAPFVRSVILRISLTFLLLLGAAYDLIFYDISGDLPGYETTHTVISNAVYGLQGTANAYTDKIVGNAALLLVIAMAFMLPPPRIASIARWIPVSIVMLATLAVTITLWKTKGVLVTWPSPVTSYINAYLVLSKKEPESETPILASPTKSSQFTKIVMVVDESVRGDFISLNNSSLETTPFLRSHATDIYNFGLASSATNCSMESRVTLRFGLNESQVQGNLRSQSFSRATIWQYAKASGFRTVYIDAFSQSEFAPSNMLPRERRFIDETISVSAKPFWKRDEEVARRLRQILDQPDRSFIMVDKYGTHVPYDIMYPPAENKFNADTSISFSLKNKSEMLKHYKNAIHWSIDGFFRTVIGNGLPPDTFLLYTSDHGQSLSETPTLMSHCNGAKYAAIGEGIVPLLAVTTNLQWQKELFDSVKQNFDQQSHFAIFPTLLDALGYDHSWVKMQFGPSLLDEVAPNHKRSVLTGDRLTPFDK